MTIKEKVLQALSIQLPAADIAAWTGLTTAQVGSCLRRMKKQGLVWKRGTHWGRTKAGLSKLLQSGASKKGSEETYIPTPVVDCPSTVWFRKHADGSVTRVS